MEAGEGVIGVRLGTLERDAAAQHDTIGTLRARSAEHDTAIAVQGRQLMDQEHDLGNISEEVRNFDAALRLGMSEIRKELNDELKGVRRSLYAATGTFTLLMMTALGYILQAILHG